MSVNERINTLRSLMQRENIAAYIIPTADFHQSEYAGDYFGCRKFMSGFTGSAGTLVVTADQSGLWTDGRYFIQAEAQLASSEIMLFKMGEEGVPEIAEYLENVLPDNSVLGFDGRVISAEFGKKLESKLKEKNISIQYALDLVGSIWEERPALSTQPVYLLPVKYSGKSASQKLQELQAAMIEKKADLHIISSLDDIAWLLNIRGDDVECNPVVLSYAAVTPDEILLFIHEEVLSEKVRSELLKLPIRFMPYNDIYSYIAKLSGKHILLDEAKMNYSMLRSIPNSCELIKASDPTTLAKAKKNAAEQACLKNCHRKDGVAVTKFIYWLKTNIGKIDMSELSVTEKLEGFRKLQPEYLGPSFDTIAGYGAHGAIVHYEATEETDIPLKSEGFLLVDSGGQYMDGTTDITRTIALGELSDELKLHYTITLKGMVSLAKARFMHGRTGSSLDVLARLPFWERNLNFNHGTGHGVGFLLNVHEGPQRFAWKPYPGHLPAVLEDGMVITDEPGIYIEGSHGIRIENELLCKSSEKNSYGQFMCFETLTLAPFEREAILPELLTEDEKCFLNEYNQKVADELIPYLTADEAAWLRAVNAKF